MELDAAEWRALLLMEAHGLDGWDFKFDTARKRFGCCNYRTKMISMSRVLVELNDEAQVTDTILHEIAHALAGPRVAHGLEWRVKARAIGCRAERYYDEKVVKTPLPRYVGTCPSCGYQTVSDRRQDSACHRCCNSFNGGRYHSAYAFVWERSSRPRSVSG